MGQNLSPQTIYNFIVNDYEDAWNSLAWNPSARGRGNFMFALQTMILLEFAARLCFTDPSRDAIRDLSNALVKIEPRYFTQLPGICADFQEFDLPYINSRGDELLWAVFDLIRNGQAHQYQQILVHLTDRLDWQISITGAGVGRHLELVSASHRPAEYLGYGRDKKKNLWLKVYPEVLFLDLKNAIAESRILSRKLTLPHLTRPGGKASLTKRKASGPFYQFESAALAESLASGGHQRI